MQKARPHFLSRIFYLLVSLLIVPLIILSCRGNGGSAYSGGPTYVPGGGSGGSGTDSGESFTADDLWKLSNAGSIDRIIELFQTERTGGSCTVVMSAADLGLPADGTVTLVITKGGVRVYGAEAQADADGSVTFTGIPLFETKAVVTVELIVKDANGLKLYAGSEEQEVDADGNLHVGLVRQYWTLPASLTVTASPASLFCDTNTWTSDSTTLSIAGLEGAPAGAAITYSWTDETGAEIGTGATLTQTVFQLVSGTAPADSLTRTFTVAVSYTDVTGTAKTVSGSVSVTAFTTLPDFTVSFITPAYSTTNSNLTADPKVYALADLSGSFTFLAVPEAPVTAFPPETTFSWTVNGSPVTGVTGGTLTVTPASEGCSSKSKTAPDRITVSCTAHKASLPDKPASVPGTVAVYKLAVPAVTSISLTKPTSATGTASPYAIANTADTFRFEVLPDSFPADTEFSWEIRTGGSGSWTSVTGTGRTVDIAPSAFESTISPSGSIGADSAGATSCEVKVTASHPFLAAADADNNKEGSTDFRLYKLFPAFTITVSSSDLPSRSGGTDAEGNAITIYTVREAYITGGEDGTEHKTFTFTATAAAGTSFPDGTTFTWKVGTTSLPATMAGATVSPKLSEAGISSPGAAAASPTAVEYTVSCTAKYGTRESDPVQETFRISPPIKIPATIREASSGGVWYQASSASGAAGTFDHLTVTGADTEENNAAKYLYCYLNSALPSGLAAADVTLNWYLGSNSSPTVPTILTPSYGSVVLLASVPRTENRGRLWISIADLKPRMQAYNIILLQVTSSNLNYVASDVVSRNKFNNDLRYNP